LNRYLKNMENDLSGVEFIEQKVRLRFEKEGSGHDWWHIHRVHQLALHIAIKENADLETVEMIALLHDVADHKLHGGDIEAGLKLCRLWLTEANCAKEKIEPILHSIENISYKGALVKDIELIKEGMIVQDADRLDAIGAIGIARAFAYGGHKGRLLYHPDEKPELHTDFETYKNSTGHTINHFYEKLFLLKDRMHTQTAKEIALERHQFMVLFVERFYSEWSGEA
jgi:uncharacterized protein